MLGLAMRRLRWRPRSLRSGSNPGGPAGGVSPRPCWARTQQLALLQTLYVCTRVHDTHMCTHRCACTPLSGLTVNIESSWGCMLAGPSCGPSRAMALGGGDTWKQEEMARVTLSLPWARPPNLACPRGGSSSLAPQTIPGFTLALPGMTAEPTESALPFTGEQTKSRSGALLSKFRSCFSPL